MFASRFLDRSDDQFFHRFDQSATQNDSVGCQQVDNVDHCQTDRSRRFFHQGVDYDIAVSDRFGNRAAANVC